MGPVLSMLLKGTVAAIIILIAYYFLKKYVLSKLKVNKWIVFTFAILMFMFTVFIAPVVFGIDQYGMYGQLVLSAVFAILFFWFWDMQFPRRSIANKNTYTGVTKNKKMDITPKSKAKPNRVKNRKE